MTTARKFSTFLEAPFLPEHSHEARIQSQPDLRFARKEKLDVPAHKGVQVSRKIVLTFSLPLGLKFAPISEFDPGVEV
jgi:hypothetical protein